MENELCWECKEGFKKLGIEKFEVFHCHHEPKENLKCWCENGRTIDLMDNGVAKTSIHGELVERNFCLKCGKKL